jgi:uncharacterized membrane protein YgdD (TMEM256/DUF423 family)
MSRFYLLCAAGNGFLVVALGAFGAHALKLLLTPAQLTVWDTSVQYQMFQTLGLLAVAWLAQGGKTGTALRWAGRLFLAGLCLFSGSLYLLALTELRWLGAVTPIGGVAFLLAWGLLGKHALSLSAD